MDNATSVIVAGGAGYIGSHMVRMLRARSELGWTPRFADIETIIAHAWQWEQRLAQAAPAA